MMHKGSVLPIDLRFVNLSSRTQERVASASNIPQPSSESLSPHRRRMRLYYVGLSDNPAITQILTFLFLQNLSKKINDIYCADIYRMNYIWKISVYVVHIEIHNIRGLLHMINILSKRNNLGVASDKQKAIQQENDNRVKYVNKKGQEWIQSHKILEDEGYLMFEG